MTSEPPLSARYLVIGLPEAGKTTFLAALWHIADTGDVPGALRAPRDVADQQHLNAIRDRWLTVEPTPRTRRGAEKRVSMLLEKDDKTSIEVLFPDMSGESFLEHWKHRAWPASYQEMVQNASGLLVFIHPEKLIPSPRIDEGNAALKALEALDPGRPATLPKPESVEEALWDPERSPTEVVLVDLLQFVDTARTRVSPLPVAVVISAWDRIEAENVQPSSWLATHLPLLNQFLETNEDRYEWRVFGVSAQGGDPVNDAQRLRAMRPLERIKVVGSGASDHDITAPIRWLIR